MSFDLLIQLIELMIKSSDNRVWLIIGLPAFSDLSSTWAAGSPPVSSAAYNAARPAHPLLTEMVCDLPLKTQTKHRQRPNNGAVGGKRCRGIWGSPQVVQTHRTSTSSLCVIFECEDEEGSDLDEVNTASVMW